MPRTWEERMRTVPSPTILSGQKEQHNMKMSGSQMFSFLRAEFVEFLSPRGSGAVLMESIHEEGQKGKQGQGLLPVFW